ncbi:MULTISPECIES: hypothetical protein [unclassified Thioclava]|uniref:hypothetical protein n=1 Tax=unclassified Thioclava TaxID=2621713 RepID=UPI0011817503|nr:MULTISPECIES: hypothetical protein [unclassified Thioclava]
MLNVSYEPSTGLPYIALLVEALRWLSWPVAIVVIAFIFREPLKGLLRNIKHLTVGNNRAEFIPQQRGNSGALDDSLPGEQRSNKVLPILEENLTPAQREIRDSVREELEDHPEHERLEILIAAVAKERLLRHFASAYSNIFGSQIRALELLNQRGGQISLEEARKEYAILQKELTDLASVPFEGYIRYLTDFRLVDVDAECIRLTPIGRDFVIWLNAIGANKDKPL